VEPDGYVEDNGQYLEFLPFAVNYGDAKAVELLLAAGARRASGEPSGLFFLAIEKRRGAGEKVRLLSKYNVQDLDVPSSILKNDYGEIGRFTPLLLSVYSSLIPSLGPPSDDATIALIEGGANVNAADSRGMTSLHWASFRGSSTIVRRLLKAGARAGATNNLGFTPLDLTYVRPIGLSVCEFEKIPVSEEKKAIYELLLEAESLQPEHSGLSGAPGEAFTDVSGWDLWPPPQNRYPLQGKLNIGRCW